MCVALTVNVLKCARMCVTEGVLVCPVLRMHSSVPDILGLSATFRVSVNAPEVYKCVPVFALVCVDVVRQVLVGRCLKVDTLGGMHVDEFAECLSEVCPCVWVTP